MLFVVSVVQGCRLCSRAMQCLHQCRACHQDLLDPFNAVCIVVYLFLYVAITFSPFLIFVVSIKSLSFVLFSVDQISGWMPTLLCSTFWCFVSYYLPLMSWLIFPFVICAVKVSTSIDHKIIFEKQSIINSRPHDFEVNLHK